MVSTLYQLSPQTNLWNFHVRMLFFQFYYYVLQIVIQLVSWGLRPAFFDGGSSLSSLCTGTSHQSVNQEPDGKLAYIFWRSLTSHSHFRWLQIANLKSSRACWWEFLRKGFKQFKLQLFDSCKPFYHIMPVPQSKFTFPLEVYKPHLISVFTGSFGCSQCNRWLKLR